MDRITIALISGAAFGVVAALLMLPLKFEDRRRAMLAAFASRFSIGFLIPLVALPVAGALKGALVGLLSSVPDAIITRAFMPIIVSFRGAPTSGG